MIADHDAPRRPRSRAGFLIAAAALVPAAFGLLSVALGQDVNWDLRNYHLHNAYAWLNRRLAVDLAPAQSQSYLNPLIDLPYYWLIRHVPPQVAGFVMGWLHGLNFALLFAIARTMVANEPGRERTAFWVAAAGCTGAAFLSQVGNTMGDNLNALFVLTAFLIVLRAVAGDAQAPRPMPLLAGGLVMGLAVGLKLTAAPFAVGLCAAIPLAVPAPASWRPDVRGLLVFAFGVAAGAACSIGYWSVELWRSFGNPIFPFYNGIFHSALALPVANADTRWSPSGILEVLAWPLVFSANPRRVSEIGTVQILWPVLYALLVWWSVTALFGRLRARAAPRMTPAERLLLTFIAASFVAWMAVFSYYRYVVPIELLAPLAIWLLCHRVFPPARTKGAARSLLALIAIVGILGWNSWGHSGWADPAFRVAAPAFDDPAHTTIVEVGSEPVGWMIPFFPAPLAFVSLGSNFPESDAWLTKVREAISARGGPVFALVAAPVVWRAEKVARIDQAVRSTGILNFEPACATARWLAERIGARVRVRPVQREDARAGCELVAAPDEAIDDALQWRAAMKDASVVLRRQGIRLDSNGCILHQASIGTAALPFQLCPIEVPPPGTSLAGSASCADAGSAAMGSCPGRE